jgi:hypothetical protein
MLEILVEAAFELRTAQLPLSSQFTFQAIGCRAERLFVTLPQIGRVRDVASQQSLAELNLSHQGGFRGLTNHRVALNDRNFLPCTKRCWETLVKQLNGSAIFPAAILVIWNSSVGPCAGAADKPNFVIFYADDLGWGETGVQGNKDIPTPHIDSIAKNGVRFIQGYVAAPYCSPSRAGLMTGRYPTRFGHEFNSVARVTGLHLKETTLADNGGPTNSTTSQNGGLRGFKQQTYEGGPRVPFFAQWKGKLPAGNVYESPVQNLDVLPTIVTAAGGTVDPAWKMDGVDLMPHLTRVNTSRPHERLYWRFGEQWAVRQGDYKLVVSKQGSGKPELYNLATNQSESKDLARAEPDKTKELQALWDTWSAEQAEPIAVDAPAGKGNRKTGGKNKKKAAVK